MPTLKTNASSLPTKTRRWSSLLVLGVLVTGCQANGLSSSTQPPTTTPPSCDTTAPLNHCGAYMPQYNPNNHS